MQVWARITQSTTPTNTALVQLTSIATAQQDLASPNNALILNYDGSTAELDNLITDGTEDSKPTAGFQRVIQRAVIHVQSSGREEVTGANVLDFVRSRHGPNNSDWQRQRRHQLVLKALAAKAESPEVLAHLPTVLDALSQVVRTNVPRGQAPTLLSILGRANDAATLHMTLASSRYSRRIPPEEVNGRWMVEPVMSGIRQLSLQVFGSYSRYN